MSIRESQQKMCKEPRVVRILTVEYWLGTMITVRDGQGGDGRGEVGSLCHVALELGVMDDGNIVAMSLWLKKDVGIEVDIALGDYCSDLDVLLSKVTTRS